MNVNILSDFSDIFLGLFADTLETATEVSILGENSVYLGCKIIMKTAKIV